MRAAAFVLALALVACVSAPRETHTLDGATAALWEGDDRAFVAFAAPGFVVEGATPLPPAAYYSSIERVRAAFSEPRIETLSATSDGDFVTYERRVSGVQTAPIAWAPLPAPEQRAYVVRERFRFVDGSIVSVSAEMAFEAPPPWIDMGAAAPRRVLRRVDFDAGVFPECISFQGEDAIVAQLMSDRLLRVDRNGAVTVAATLPVRAGPGAGVICAAAAANGDLYVTVTGDAESQGLWRVRGGQAQRVAAMPALTQPNGLDIDAEGNIWIADSLGAIWGWREGRREGRREVALWLRHPWLSPRPFTAAAPGTNGVRRHGDAIYATVSDAARIVRIDIEDNGAAGAVSVAAEGVPGDDFAIGPDGSFYVATHPFNTIVRIAPDGVRSVIASAAEGAVGSTAVAIAPDGAIAFVADGGLFAPLPGHPIEPVLVVLRRE